MKILTFSDLHLEFGEPWNPPPEDAGDVLVLAGDIAPYKEKYKDDLGEIFDKWTKPIILIPGNHEYYDADPIGVANDYIRLWLQLYYPHVRFLLDEPCTIDGVQFFGGTMWTNFAGSAWWAMKQAQDGMSDFRLIRNADGSLFTPTDSVRLHEEFVAKLGDWLIEESGSPKVVVTHHSPTRNPRTQYRGSPLEPAFNSLDMEGVIEVFQPAVWVYGHTHENEPPDRTIGRTRIVTNQRGYPRPDGSNECRDFREDGVPIDV